MSQNDAYFHIHQNDPKFIVFGRNASMIWEVWILERVEGDLGWLVDKWEALALDPLPHGDAGNTLQQSPSESTPGQENEVKWGWAPRK